MGSAQSSVAPEVLVAGAVVAAGSLTAYGLFGRSSKDTPAQKPSQGKPSTSASASSSQSKKQKKKKASSEGNGSDAELDSILAAAAAARERENQAQPRVVAFPEVVPGSFEQGSTADDSEAALSQSQKEKKIKRKKGKKTAAAIAPVVVAAPSGVSSSSIGATGSAAAQGGAQIKSPEGSIIHVPADTPTEPERPLASKKEKKKRAAKTEAPADFANSGKAVAPQPSTATPTAGPSSGSGFSSAPDDASWTRVETRKRTSAKEPSTSTGAEQELLTSDTNLTTSVTDSVDSSSAVTDENADDAKTEDENLAAGSTNRKTFAEKMLGKPRKTGVEDMEETPLQPPLARVLRVKPGTDERPAKGFSWGDYEEYAGADDGTSADGDEDDAWEEVKSKRRGKLERSPSAQGAATAPETLTKRQRQNAARREAAKADKQAQESERQRRLAGHQRELEHAKIAEQFASGSSGKGKKVSGGMQASVAEGGKLIWE